MLALLRYCGFRSLVCACVVCAEEKQVRKPKLRGHTIVWQALSKKTTSPAVMFTTRLVLPSATTWTEKSTRVANLPHIHKHTRALPAACCFMALLLYCGCFWCCYYRCLCMALSCLLITKKRKKKRTSQKAKKAKNFGKVLFLNN